MSFDPTLPTIRDSIRFALADTSGDPATEIVVDQTYDALLATFVDWRQAAVAIGGAMLAALQNDVKSYTATGDFSVTYRDPSRIEAQIAAWQVEIVAGIANEGLGKVVTITGDYLTGHEAEVREW